MLRLANENIETMTIKFEGNDDIDLETLSNVLKSTVNSLKTIADSQLADEQYCKFKLKDVKKGSIILDITSVIVSNYAPFIAAIPTVLGTFNDILDIKKHLSGEEPKEIKRVDDKHVSVENHNGNVQIFNIDTLNLHGSDDSIEKNLSRAFKTLSNDGERKGVSYIVSDNKDSTKTIDFSHDDLKLCSKSVDVSKLTSQYEESVSEGVLRVIKPDFFGESKWNFFFYNQRIDAEILDKDFMDKVHRNEILFDGDTKLRVSLRVKYKVDASGLSIENEKATYSVLSVLEVIQNHVDEQTLFD